jgi:hypothetical protein
MSNNLDLLAKILNEDLEIVKNFQEWFNLRFTDSNFGKNDFSTPL